MAELFPDGYFVSNKGNLEKGQIPCGCSKSPKWKDWQWLLRARRVAKGKFTVHGFVGEFKTQQSKVLCECLIDGHTWTPTVGCIVNGLQGCPKCYGNERKTTQQAFDICKEICETEGYEPIGFPNEYKNAYSRFEYKCPIHGVQNVCYHGFVNKNSRCPDCWRDRQKETGGFYGLYKDRLEDPDLLYVLSISEGEYIKVGRTFDLKDRLGTMKYKAQANTKDIQILRLFTDSHQTIWDWEQKLHLQLKESGFQFYHSKWNSVELFKTESLPLLNGLLDASELKELSL